MITLHYLNNSRSHRILWLLEELELEYQLILYQRNPITQLAPETLKEIHPLGKSPAIEDDGFLVVESGAIIEYLMEKYGENSDLMPSDLKQKTAAKTWLHYSEGTIMPLIFLQMIMRAMEEKSPFFVRPISKKLTQGVRDFYLDANITANIHYIADQLSDSDYLLGEHLTVADIAMSFPIETYIKSGEYKTLDPSVVGVLRSYGLRFQQRKAYKRAVERAGDYAYLIT